MRFYYKTNETSNPKKDNSIPKVKPELALSVEAAVVVPGPVEVPDPAVVPDPAEEPDPTANLAHAFMESSNSAAPAGQAFRTGSKLELMSINLPWKDLIVELLTNVFSLIRCT